MCSKRLASTLSQTPTNTTPDKEMETFVQSASKTSKKLLLIQFNNYIFQHIANQHSFDSTIFLYLVYLKQNNI